MRVVAKEEVIDDVMQSITLDPLDKYEASPERLVNACGCLLAWAWNAVGQEDPIEAMLNCYQFPSSEMTGGKIDKDGTYRYPGDPPFYPLASIARGTVVVHAYQYSIVGIVVGDKTYITRMD